MEQLTEWLAAEGKQRLAMVKGGWCQRRGDLEERERERERERCCVVQVPPNLHTHWIFIN